MIPLTWTAEEERVGGARFLLVKALDSELRVGFYCRTIQYWDPAMQMKAIAWQVDQIMEERRHYA